MSTAEAAAAPDSISLALAFHQAPGHFPELLRGLTPLPPDMGRLLRLASGAAPASELPDAAAFVQADMRAVARFFIEQVLLARGADHYRVLGLTPDATAEQIKEHYRLLMRVFHPDRGEDPSVLADSIASRINLAYNALKLPQERAAYDAKRLDTPRATHAPVRPRSHARQRAPGRTLPPWVARYLPQMVLAGVAALATAAVAWVYVNQEPPMALGAGGGSFEPRPMPNPKLVLSSREAVPTIKPVAAKSDVSPPKGEPDKVLERADGPASAQEVPPSDEPKAVAREPARDAVMKLTTSISVKSVPEAQPASSPPLQRIAETAPAPTIAENKPVVVAVAAAQQSPAPPVSLPVQVAPTASLSPPPARRSVSLDDLAKLVAQFSSEYEKGDLERFLSLFDEGARVEGGGKDRIRSDYADLFRTTQARQLVIWDMKWWAEGELYRGEGQYRAKVQRQGEEASRSYTGKIRIEAVAGPGGNARVKGLYH